MLVNESRDGWVNRKSIPLDKKHTDKRQPLALRNCNVVSECLSTATEQ